MLVMLWGPKPVAPNVTGRELVREKSGNREFNIIPGQVARNNSDRRKRHNLRESRNSMSLKTLSAIMPYVIGDWRKIIEKPGGRLFIGFKVTFLSRQQSGF
jgi:hypothetical protein